jgi:transcriptional regulator with XRE-family HTH domain
MDFKPETLDVESVALRLLASRVALELTQTRLCKITGMTKQTWNNYERAYARISVNNAIVLCQAFGLTLDWVFRGTRAGLSRDIQKALAKLPKDPSELKTLAKKKLREPRLKR